MRAVFGKCDPDDEETKETYGGGIRLLIATTRCTRELLRSLYPDAARLVDDVGPAVENSH